MADVLGSIRALHKQISDARIASEADANRLTNLRDLRGMPHLNAEF